MTYMRIKNDKSYWECSRVFAPTGEKIELFVSAPGEGQPPDQKQRAFYSWVERNHDAIISSVEPLLRSQFEESTGKPLLAPFASLFKPTGFSIPRLGDNLSKWEMFFEPKGDDYHLFSVEMLGAEAQSITDDSAC